MPARLHHERIFKSDASPARWMILTHGIYGAGSNWRGIARKLTTRRTDWGVVLVDLRLHGRSDAGEPPHTLDACAEDLRALATELGGIEVVAGHSFGGKVALAARSKLAVAQTWMLDSSPSARPERADDPDNSVGRVLALMRSLPDAWAKREDFVAAVVEAGHALGLAQWLAMNVVPDTAGVLRLRLDLDAIGALLADYYAQNLWSIALAPGGTLEMVVATRSDTVDDRDRAALASAPPHVHTHTLDAGHWLHIDAPDAIVELFAAELPH